MGRQKKPDDGQVHHAKTNGATEEMIKAFVAEHEDEDSQIIQINRNATKAAQPHKDRQAEIEKEAAEAGIPKKVFKAQLKARKKRREAELVRSGLNAEQQVDYDNLGQKGLDDMPLFANLPEQDAGDETENT